MTPVRPMQTADIPSVVAIHQAAYPADHDSARLSAVLEQVLSTLPQRQPFFYVATASAEQVVGFVVAGERVDDAIRRFQRGSILA